MCQHTLGGFFFLELKNASVCVCMAKTSFDLEQTQRRTPGPKTYPRLWIMCKDVNANVVSTMCSEADWTGEHVVAGAEKLSFSLTAHYWKKNTSSSWKTLQVNSPLSERVTITTTDILINHENLPIDFVKN